MPPGSEDDHGSDFACADWLTGLDTTNPCVDDAMNVSSQIRSASIFSDASLLVDSSGTVKNATVFCGAGSSDRGTISCMFAGQWRNWEMLARGHLSWIERRTCTALPTSGARGASSDKLPPREDGSPAVILYVSKISPSTDISPSANCSSSLNVAANGEDDSSFVAPMPARSMAPNSRRVGFESSSEFIMLPSRL